MSPTRKLFLFIALPLLILFGGLVYYVLGKNGKIATPLSTTSGQKSDCSQLQMPVDINKVSAILYPGQYRGGNYKPHGGFRLNNTADNLADVTAPIDATVTDGSRYIEQGETQYLFDFKTNCGLEYRFDHLKTLSDKFQAAAATLPQPQVDNSMTSNVKGVSVTSGEIVATAVGFEKGDPGPNVSFDFGVYDKRQKNTASKDATWLASHQQYGDQAIYAVCWFDLFPATDAATLRGLPAGDAVNGKQSDYCQ